jgi:pyruvate/2-oxoacid:ferredoxin oxidoreductase alpha subunit
MLPVSIVIPEAGAGIYQAAEIPGQKMVENVAGRLKLDPKHAKYGGSGLSDMLQMQKSMDNAQKAMAGVSVAWKKRFKRTLEPVEKFMMDDAEIAIIAYGPVCENAKIAVKRLRDEGEKVGLLRLIMLRPVPEAEISASLQKVSRIGIVDTQVSLGGWSKLYQAIRTFYSGFATNFISGDLISVQDFVDMLKRLKAAAKNERVWMVK